MARKVRVIEIDSPREARKIIRELGICDKRHIITHRDDYCKSGWERDPQNTTPIRSLVPCCSDCKCWGGREEE